MSTSIKSPLAGMSFQTREIPTVYVNHASPSLGFNDIRIYFGDIFPKELGLAVAEKPVHVEPTFEPRICVIVNPEFAKSLVESLSKAIQKYEEVFGPMKPQPSQASVNEKLSRVDSSPVPPSTK